ncbi:complex I intermediate-associated protein-like protein CIA30 [Amylocarpus encephaloides]|uniref:Complex I intermediate-associated protein-like protein CIA30 n=1 Tax=Amylocarpus encephaloides TaxID=45428 RepID=A0A9P8C460_9HELO|nr:complex I intermediate-associated protein-like protein CIA30 [Amylocarpus encephaloides]
MRVTPNLSRGFIGRSLDEFKRQAQFALSGDAVKRATKPFPLVTFDGPDSIKACKVMSDQDIGGFSQSHLDYIAPTTTSRRRSSDNIHGHAKFHGNISIELPKNNPQIQRTGYAAWRTHDKPPTIFGKALWNVDVYGFLALRIKSDGRKYFVNLQTESIVPTDIHQHRLYARRPGEWETVLIKWGEFVRTNHGVVVEPQREMLKQKVRTLGIGLIDRVPGKFELRIERVWATNFLGKEDLMADDRVDEGRLKDKHGERIKWGRTGNA